MTLITEVFSHHSLGTMSLGAHADKMQASLGVVIIGERQGNVCRTNWLYNINASTMYIVWNFALFILYFIPEI